MNSGWSEMYQRGYDNAAICFAYIPDFKNNKEKRDFERGLKDGYAKIEQLKSRLYQLKDLEQRIETLEGESDEKD